MRQILGRSGITRPRPSDARRAISSASAYLSALKAALIASSRSRSAGWAPGSGGKQGDVGEAEVDAELPLHTHVVDGLTDQLAVELAAVPPFLEIHSLACWRAARGGQYTERSPRNHLSRLRQQATLGPRRRADIRPTSAKRQMWNLDSAPRSDLTQPDLCRWTGSPQGR